MLWGADKWQYDKNINCLDPLMVKTADAAKALGIYWSLTAYNFNFSTVHTIAANKKKVTCRLFLLALYKTSLTYHITWNLGVPVPVGRSFQGLENVKAVPMYSCQTSRLGELAIAWNTLVRNWIVSFNIVFNTWYWNIELVIIIWLTILNVEFDLQRNLLLKLLINNSEQQNVLI